MTESQADFARRLGLARSRITALKHAGRLVMVGEQVDVEASIARINETRSSAHDGQNKRAAEEVPAQDAAPRRIDAQARKEHLSAELLQIDLDERRGKLLRAEEVLGVVAGAATTLRTRLEALPDTLAPQLAAMADEQQVRATLADHVEMALAELSERMRALGAA